MSPVQDLRLESLNVSDCKNLHDLSPLATMKLRILDLPPDPTKGMDAIRAMATLQHINNMPPAEFWKQWDAKK